MSILTKNKIINTNFFYLLILGLFSFFVNLYYAKLGSFPIDTFLHYDSAYRILNDELPVRDYWIVSGLAVDLIQSFFFKIFGTNWFAYSLHASFFNCIITIFVYIFLTNIKISKLKAFIFSISFSLLSYTISGTPFVDLHATFFLLIATLLIINNLGRQKNYLWFFITFLIFLSFFSKQVPVTYAILVYSIVLLLFFTKNRDFKKISIIFFSIIFHMILLIFVLKINKIEFGNFYIQYLDYPQSIGSSRLNNFEFAINSFFNKYKFIIIPLFLLIFLKLKKSKIFSEESIGHLIFVIFTIILIFHQLMTKNQIFIYFLIPIIFGLLEQEIYTSKYKYKKYISIFMILILAMITTKYHIRYNENKKFHELTNIQLEKKIKAEKIHKNLRGLYWKNPHYEGSPSDEVLILNKAQKIISNTKEHEIMLISHYKFLDSIIKKKMNYPSKTFTMDGASIPLTSNKHYNYYKNFLKNKIKKNNINKVFFFKHEKIPFKIITNYIEKNCYNITEDEIFYVFELKCFK